MIYLMIYDDSRAPAATKLSAACAAYRARFGRDPNVALVSLADAGIAADGLAVRAVATVQRDCYWIGYDAPRTAPPGWRRVEGDGRPAGMPRGIWYVDPHGPATPPYPTDQEAIAAAWALKARWAAMLDAARREGLTYPHNGCIIARNGCSDKGVMDR